MVNRNAITKKLNLGSLVFLALTLLSGLSACNSENGASSSSPPNPLVARGKTVYVTVCIACHNADPHKAGSIGPAVFGASKELLEARVLNASYPPGYKPQRETHTMPAFPQFKDDIPALYAYLNSN